MDAQWNPWHGCHKFSAGCLNCYVYRRDQSIGRDASIVQKTADFNLPVRRARHGGYKIPAGTGIWTCFTSDFLVEEADAWRQETFLMMRERSDCQFTFLTKRIKRLYACLPSDWGDGYENLTIGCTMENQEMADERLEAFLSLPIKRRLVICEPMLGPIDFRGMLSRKLVSQVIIGGESGDGARLMRYDWALHVQKQCRAANVSFQFKQTGAKFEKDGKLFKIERRLQMRQARKAGINLNFS